LTKKLKLLQMKNINKNTVYLTLGTLVVGLFLGWIIFGGSPRHQSTDTQFEQTKKTTWTCSMHPQIRQNEFGQCPLCGMDLIPLSDDANVEDNLFEIKMSERAMQLANIQTSVVAKTKPINEIQLNGKIKADERKIFSQSSHIPGRIEKLMISYTGEYVQKGEVIAYVYSPELISAQQELLIAQKNKDTQADLYKATVEKLKNWKLTEKQINKILEVGVVQEQLPILADVSGVVLNKKVKLGDYINKGQSIYEVANLNTIWVLFDIYESDIPWVKINDKVLFTVSSMPGETFDGTISFIDPIINPKTRVASARVEVNNSNMHLKPEMFVSGTISSSIKNETLIVPKSAVMWTGERSVVYVKVSNTKEVSFLMKEVVLGPSLGDSFIIKSGIESGDEIATNGTFSIDAAAQLAGKSSMMNPKEGNLLAGHNHSEEITISTRAKDELKPLFDSYFALKDALTEDNIEAAITYLKDMSNTLSKVNMGVFTGEAHGVWMKHSSILDKEIREASSANKIEAMRLSFKSISDQMVMLIKTFEAIDETVYIQFCPMVNNDQGAEWLSKDEAILNPYFGAKMLRCGKVNKVVSENK
jgi:Cu(I)/Ag(I) efflux system membrane fusion protein